MAQEYIIDPLDQLYPIQEKIHKTQNGEFIFLYWDYNYENGQQSIKSAWSQNGGTQWLSSTLVTYETSVEWRAAVAFSQDDTIHLLRPSADNSKFEYYRGMGEMEWVSDFDLPPDDVGFYDAAVNSLGSLHVLYYNDDTYYCARAGEGFETILTWSDQLNRYPQILLIDREDVVHLLYEEWVEETDAYDQKYTYYNGATWSTPETVFAPESDHEYVEDEISNAIVDENGKIWWAFEVSFYDEGWNFTRDRIGYMTNATGSWVFTAIVDTEIINEDADNDWGVSISADQNGKYLTWVTQDDDLNPCLFTTKIGETPQKLHTGNYSNELWYYSPIMAENSSNFVVNYYDDSSSPSTLSKFFIVQYTVTLNLTHKQIFENQFTNQAGLLEFIGNNCVVPLVIDMATAATLCNKTDVWSEENGFYLNSRNMGQIVVCRRTNVANPQYVYYDPRNFYVNGYCGVGSGNLAEENLEFIGLYWAEITDCEG
jgi:hypothetical protein